MDYKEALEKIESLQFFGSRPGLERVGELLSRLGSPQDKLKIVHVAGTNGKGTTCELISSVLCEAGYKTGLYLSPHVSDFRERMQINGEMIPREKLVLLAQKVFEITEQMAREEKIITEFELITAIAMLWYAEENCDIVVLEVGLGGRLDATNVIKKPLVSVITSISLDHTKILGGTVEKIAAEKCGIIKEGGITVVSPCQKPEAMEIIKNIAAKRHNMLIDAGETDARVVSTNISGTILEYKEYSLHLPFIGAHQVQNAKTALAVLEILQEIYPKITIKTIADGFSAAKLPARLEVLSQSPLVLLDGAHNPGGTAALAEAVREYFPGQKIIAIMGMLADKDVDLAVKNLSGLISQVVTVSPSSSRAMSAEDLAARWERLGVCAYPAAGFDCALEKAFGLLKPDGVLLICGSLYLAGDLRGRVIKLLKK